jgi:hypothetical protein
MQLRDIPACAEAVSSHPILGPRFGNSLPELCSFWSRLLAKEWFSFPIAFEATLASRVRLLGISISVFATEEFLREAKSPPFFWVGPEISNRIAQGRAPLLTTQQVAEANSDGGLNLVVWQCGSDPVEMNRPEAWDVGVTAFLNIHRGFRLREIITQAETPLHLSGLLNAGALLLRSQDGTYTDPRRAVAGQEHDLQQTVAIPHILGLNREMASQLVGSWFSTLFLYRPPHLGFSRSEQRLLSAALEGGTDEQLSDELGVSLFTVKKMWRAIYTRVTVHSPELVVDHIVDDALLHDRGKEKKRRLVAYLRNHVEELRPASRKSFVD